MRTKGNIDGYEYHVVHFEEGSEYGIKEGRISKLWIFKGNALLVHYDREWDKRPTAETKKVYQELLKRFN